MICSVLKCLNSRVINGDFPHNVITITIFLEIGPQMSWNSGPKF